MFNLLSIREILAEQRRQGHLSREVDRECELMIEAIDEGRFRIIPREIIID